MTELEMTNTRIELYAEFLNNVISDLEVGGSGGKFLEGYVSAMKKAQETFNKLFKLEGNEIDG